MLGFTLGLPVRPHAYMVSDKCNILTISFSIAKINMLLLIMMLSGQWKGGDAGEQSLGDRQVGKVVLYLYLHWYLYLYSYLCLHLYLYLEGSLWVIDKWVKLPTFPDTCPLIVCLAFSRLQYCNEQFHWSGPGLHVLYTHYLLSSVLSPPSSSSSS